MIFSSLIFLYLFLPVCLALYFIVPGIKGKNAVLIIVSLAFYAWGEPVRILLLLGSALLNYLFARGIGHFGGQRSKKLCLIGSLVLNIGMLGVFKYTGLILKTVNSVSGSSFNTGAIPQLLGISFYTFQVISYVADCYLGKVEVQKNVFRFLLYVMLFPQLIAGPIVRYETIAAEIDKRATTLEDFRAGFSRFIVGLAKKVLLADQLFRITENILGSPDRLTVLGSWYGIAVYTLYIYFDFSGYSDIAIGLGRIFGFRFNENFDHPYMCSTITEFWRRWHISLGTFFRDYVYIPLGGNRRHQPLNIMVVWFLTGLWHGASWNYVIWGVYFGVFVMLEKYTILKWKKIPRFILQIYSKLVIVLGFGIFYFEDFGKLGTLLKNLTPFNGNGWCGDFELASMCNNMFLLIAGIVCCFPLLKLAEKLTENRPEAKAVLTVGGSMVCAGLLALSSILLVDSMTNAFLYWRF